MNKYYFYVASLTNSLNNEVIFGVKIGITNNTKRRQKEYETGYPAKPMISIVYEIESDNAESIAMALENQFKVIFSDQRLRNTEYCSFSIDSEEVSMIEKVIEYEKSKGICINKVNYDTDTIKNIPPKYDMSEEDQIIYARDVNTVFSYEHLFTHNIYFNNENYRHQNMKFFMPYFGKGLVYEVDNINLVKEGLYYSFDIIDTIF